MKLISHLLLVLTVTLVTACGGADSSAAEMAGLMDGITAVLKDVKDVDGAKAAKAKLEPLMAKMNEFAKNAAKNASETPKEMDADEEKMIADSSAAYGAEMGRIMGNPALGEVLMEMLVPKTE